MVNAPTFVADYEGASWDTTTTPKTTGSFDPSSGDVLVAMVADENDNGTENYTFTSTPGTETWTERTESAGASSADGWVQAATTIMLASRSGFTVSAARTAGSTEKYGLVVARFSGSDGIGATGATTDVPGVGSPPSWSVTTSFDNSAIVVIFVDFNAADGASRTWRTVNGFTPTAGNGQELVYFRNSSNYTVYAAYYPDVGTAGAKTLGLSAPTGQETMATFVEVRGSDAVVANPQSERRLQLPIPFTGPGVHPVARALQLLGDASGAQFPAPEDTATAVDLVTLTAAVPLDDAPSAADAAVVAAAVPLSDTAAAADGSDLTAVVSFTMPDTATTDDSLSIQVAATTSPDQALPRIPGVAIAPRAAAGQTYGDATTPESILAVTLDDTATGTDLIAPAVAAPLADTASGTDDVVATVAAPLVETGTGTDSLGVAVVNPIDAFQASPAIAWMFTSPKASSQQNVGDTTSGLITLSDTAAGSDSLSAAPAVPLSETAAGTDAIAPITATAPLPETAAGDDVLAVTVTTTLTETGAAADNLLVTSDTTSDANQAMRMVIPVAISPRTAAGQMYGDASGGAVPVSLAESVTADDSLSISVTITVADTAAAADSMGAVAGPLLTELVSAADSLAIAVVLSLTESSTAVDNLFIGGSGIQGNVRPRGDRSSSGNAYPRGSRAIIGSGG